jgi:GT2 family glycosyltransferase
MYVPDSKIYHMGGATVTDSKKGKKILKNEYFYHLFKNKLTTILKNNFGFRLFFSILIYFFDLTAYMLNWLFTGRLIHVLLASKGVIWNIKNLRNIFQKKRQFKNSNINNYSFSSYYGVWKDIFRIMMNFVTHT